MLKGKLYLIPSPLSDTAPDLMLAVQCIDLINSLDLFFVENVRTTRRFFSRLGIRNIQNITFEVLNKDTSHSDVENLIKKVESGSSAGILSEAGCPGIADPGSLLIKLAHQKDIDVIPVTGPSSILLGLMASGFNGQNFAFHGYLPIEKNKRKHKIRELQQLVLSIHQTQIFMETPYRNNQLLNSLLSVLDDEILVCIASDITGKNEFIKTREVKYWKKNIPDLHKKPTIFLLYHK